MSDTEDEGYHTEVDDNETLYRSVWLEPQCFFYDAEGILHVSKEAFADRKFQPSLYRKHLCEDPPHSNPPRLDSTQAVVSLIARKIREAGHIPHKSEVKPSAEAVTHIIEIICDVSAGQHESHCIVIAYPEFPNSGAFNKLKRILARLVEQFDIEPCKEFLEQVKRQ